MNWGAEKLQELLEELRARGGDRTDIEVKAGSNGLPKLGDTLSAFGNMPGGGTIIIGVAEGQGFQVTGIGGKIADFEAGVASLARDHIEPPVVVDFHSFSLPQGDVVIAEVEGLPLKDRPARFKNKAFLRQADGDYEMSEQELQHLELLKTQREHPTHPDKAVISGSSVEDLDPDLTAAYIKTCRTGSRRAAQWTNEQVLYYTGVTSNSGQLTMAGMYALGIAPQREFPQLSITAAVQRPFDGSGNRTHDLAHFTGPLPDLLEQALEWVIRNTRPDLVYLDSGHAKDVTELPMNAVREIIANALVHRSLEPISDSKNVDIRLRDDVLSISSPGGLWGIAESQLGHPGSKSAVNPVLYQICKNTRGSDSVRIIEGEGGGIIEAMNEMRAAHLRTPRFIDKGIAFTVLLSRHTLLNDKQLEWLQDQDIDSHISSEALSVLARMQDGEEWSRAKIRQEFKLSNDESLRIVEEVRAHPQVHAHGNGRGRKYFMPPDNAGATPTPLRISSMTKNGPAILESLSSGPLSFNDIVKATGLSPSATRYALGWLQENAYTRMLGKHGDPHTTYEKVKE
ncbi:ATP-binding protein [uncultured Corynebacterium sp.]|uniref:ATP-binding protein n=1 Tax=uncultured Corynebacterium sp. TaxID=159447 RepID=UPI0025EF3B28|nr:ATP-binding protein [uncultured Corynebacterium sp.]